MSGFRSGSAHTLWFFSIDVEILVVGGEPPVPSLIGDKLCYLTSAEAFGADAYS